MTIEKAQLKALVDQGSLPPVVADLLTEIERLEDGEQVADELCAQLSGLLDQIATIVRGPALPGQRHGYGDLPSRVKTVIAERNTLRAELAGLRTGYDAQNEVITELRKDAERYRWLRGKQTFIWLIQDWFPGAELTYVDAEIDAAMAKEASHD